jgi:hypothetical protein
MLDKSKNGTLPKIPLSKAKNLQSFILLTQLLTDLHGINIRRSETYVYAIFTTFSL